MIIFERFKKFKTSQNGKKKLDLPVNKFYFNKEKNMFTSSRDFPKKYQENIKKFFKSLHKKRNWF